MNDSSANPVYVALLFLMRCLVPLVILFGISYLFRRLGLVAESPEPPLEKSDEERVVTKKSPPKKAPPKKKQRRSNKK